MAGILRDFSTVHWKSGPLRTSRIDDRFAGLLAGIPPGERVGFVTDAPEPEAGSRWFDALYALSPRIVGQGPEGRLLVADLLDPDGLLPLCARRHLRIVARGGPGVALLERE
jgi:hypothetical protein